VEVSVKARAAKKSSPLPQAGENGFSFTCLSPYEIEFSVRDTGVLMSV
jgi:hypothetical protein